MRFYDTKNVHNKTWKRGKFQGNHLPLKNIHGKVMERYYDTKKHGKYGKFQGNHIPLINNYQKSMERYYTSKKYMGKKLEHMESL